MEFEVILAVDEKWGIGKDGSIPWFVPEDLQFFKEKTDGNIIIMGSNTFNSLGRKPLKNRLNVVLTRAPWIYKKAEKKYLNLIFVKSIDDIAIFSNKIETMQVLPFLKFDYKLFVIGGANIYDQFIRDHRVSTIWITFIKGEYGCDTVYNPFKENTYYILNEVIKNTSDYCIKKYIKFYM